MNRPLTILCLALLFTTALTGCSSDDGPTDPPAEQPFTPTPPVNPQDRGDRLFGLALSQGDQGWEATFDLARQAGVQVVELPLLWNEIETAPGVYQDPGGVLAATAFYGASDVQVLLSLAVINTVASTVPAHLAGLAWDDDDLITAFGAMADWVLGQLPADVTVAGVAVGNEVDSFLADDQWAPYEIFFAAAVAHLHESRPDVPVGVKCTVYGGVFGVDENRIKALNQHSDVIMLNYYQLDSAFEVIAPLYVHNNFTTLGNDFPGREIWLTEVGFPSGSEYCESSEAIQAIFYHELFTAWDLRRQQFTCLIANWLHDQPQTVIDQWEQYYGSSDPAFLEFLSTLGLRTYRGRDKDAWLQLLAELEARGWGEAPRR